MLENGYCLLENIIVSFFNRRIKHFIMFWRIRSNIANTRDCGSSGYPNTEKRVENTKRTGVFLTKFEHDVCIADETLSYVFDISSQSKQKLR